MIPFIISGDMRGSMAYEVRDESASLDDQYGCQNADQYQASECTHDNLMLSVTRPNGTGETVVSMES